MPVRFLHRCFHCTFQSPFFRPFFFLPSFHTLTYVFLVPAVIPLQTVLNFFLVTPSRGEPPFAVLLSALALCTRLGAFRPSFSLFYLFLLWTLYLSFPALLVIEYVNACVNFFFHNLSNMLALSLPITFLGVQFLYSSPFKGYFPPFSSSFNPPPCPVLACHPRVFHSPKPPPPRPPAPYSQWLPFSLSTNPSIDSPSNHLLTLCPACSRLFTEIHFLPCSHSTSMIPILEM